MNMNTIALIHKFLGIESETYTDPVIQQMLDSLHTSTETVVSHTTPSQPTDPVVQSESEFDVRFTKPESDEKNVPRKHYSKSDIETVWNTYLGHELEGVCILCGVKRIFFDDRLTWEMAHVKSHVEGGSGELSNIRPICFTCNRSMGSKHFMTFLIERYPERYHLVINRLKL